jgi:hypothetical protein
MGATHVGEDLSETAFLLVENYNMTASVGLRVGRESLEPFTFTGLLLFIESFGCC